MRKTWLCITLACALFGATVESPVRAAEDAAPDVESAEQALSALDYAKAQNTAETALKNRRGLTHDQLVRLTKIVAMARASNGDATGARDAFVLLLIYDPEFKMDMGLSPKLTTPFFEAKGIWRGYAKSPGISVDASPNGKGGTLSITTRDPTHIVKKVTVGHRWSGSGTYTKLSVNVGDGVPVVLPAPPVGTTRLDYFAQAEDEHENIVFEVGSAQSPKSAVAVLEPTAAVSPGTKKEEGSSIFSSPWFWIGTGVVLAGAATGTYFLTRSTKEEHLPPSQGSFGGVVFCGAAKCN